SDEPVAFVKIDVREIHREDRGIVRDAGVEQQRPQPADGELEAREKARVPALQSVADVPVRVHIADTIEYRERLPLLQDAFSIIDARRGRVDVILVVDEYELTRRAHLSSLVLPEAAASSTRSYNRT